MEEAVLGCRSSYRSQAGKIDSAVRGGRGGYRRFPVLHAVAARRLPLCAAANDPTSDTLVIASPPTAPWDQPPAGCRRCQAGKEEVQDPIGFFHIDIAEVRTEQGKL